LESGQSDDVIDVEKFGKRSRSSNNGITSPFQTVRKKVEVDMNWAKTVVCDGLPMSLFDNPEVHETVLMTSECGQNYIRTKPGVVNEPTLTHRTLFTTKLIPKLDHLIDDKNMRKMREMTHDLTVVVSSDEWTTVNHHPIVNIIMGVRSLHTLLDSLDTMGQEKTMDFITALILEHIKEIGEDRVPLVLFCIGMRAYLVHHGLDPLKQEKQARSETCRSQSELGFPRSTR
jgi:hypothetical protein